MQPRHVEEIHLVFKARQPAGLEAVQGSGSGQANSQQQQDLQKLRNMLQSGVYFVKLIGTIVDKDATHDHEGDGEVYTNGDASQRLPNRQRIDWVFEFKDTPEAGQQATITRLISRTKFADGDRIAFLNFFGYDYVQRYYVEGERFYNQDTTLFLHRMRELPAVQSGQNPLHVSELPAPDKCRLLDASESWLLEASIDIADGKTQELRDRATRQLMSMRETLSPSVKLEKPDRLALDTRIPVRVRQI
ncbi:Mediator of RNA polymerase II transcription subunit 18 [Exophiala xenobiotica]|uniref:Mediator of RNA polymerase II transcription subunit 18 n=1 Tax=Lithohypha guttulata TaxID=1690604 RepID=A0ABR0K451_9EURO|nr:Mediator of RNA polymerase II transcription subunit 18 [Lithohypha guttulata]KAK5314101.1 Mediator of RNA polymerase II transcription subunit 18 [Exophiala xenobiotica]